MSTFNSKDNLPRPSSPPGPNATGLPADSLRDSHLPTPPDITEPGQHRKPLQEEIFDSLRSSFAALEAKFPNIKIRALLDDNPQTGPSLCITVERTSPRLLQSLGTFLSSSAPGRNDHLLGEIAIYAPSGLEPSPSKKYQIRFPASRAGFEGTETISSETELMIHGAIAGMALLHSRRAMRETSTNLADEFVPFYRNAPVPHILSVASPFALAFHPWKTSVQIGGRSVSLKTGIFVPNYAALLKGQGATGPDYSCEFQFVLRYSRSAHFGELHPILAIDVRCNSGSDFQLHCKSADAEYLFNTPSSDQAIRLIKVIRDGAARSWFGGSSQKDLPPILRAHGDQDWRTV